MKGLKEVVVESSSEDSTVFGMKIAKNWKQFFALETFERPETVEDAKERAFINLNKYFQNYTIITVGFVFLAILSDLAATLITGAGVGCAYAVTTNPSLRRKLSVSRQKLYAVAAVYVFFIVACTSAIQLICFGIASAAVFVVLHATIHDSPPDFN